MSAETLRLFIAVPIDERWREQLIKQTTLLQSNSLFQKWIHPEDYHITLKFLGDTSMNQLQQIKILLDSVAKNTNSFELTEKEWGTFGSNLTPNILWAGVGGDLNSLKKLQRKLEDSLDGLFPKENREFSPHLTIARRYKGKAPLTNSIQDYIPDTPKSIINWTVKEFNLYQSHLQKTPMYESIASFKFGANNF